MDGLIYAAQAAYLPANHRKNHIRHSARGEHCFPIDPVSYCGILIEADGYGQPCNSAHNPRTISY
ncbi:hypothetical protein D3C71_1682900 [compost metagenome]